MERIKDMACVKELDEFASRLSPKDKSDLYKIVRNWLDIGAQTQISLNLGYSELQDKHKNLVKYLITRMQKYENIDLRSRINSHYKTPKRKS